MYKTRKQCREETGMEPEDISKLAYTSRAALRIKHPLEEYGNKEEYEEWVYEGIKSNYQKQQRLASQTKFNCKSCKTPMAEANKGYKNHCHDCWIKLEEWER
jgi:hypothetical protein